MFGFNLELFILLIPPLLLALTIHEFAHGFVAYLLGDPTAKNAGRLSFNPLKHLDPLGTIVLFVTQAIGWAKPVPVNPNYFKKPWRDMAIVSFAGPASNFLLAIFFGIIFHILYNLGQGGSNWTPLLKMAYLGIQLNIGLAIFNLLPIPPLDGSKILAKFLPLDLRARFLQAEFIGFLVIMLLSLTGLLGKLIYPVLKFFSNAVLYYTGFIF